MKKIILFIVLLFSSVSLFAQQSTVYNVANRIEVIRSQTKIMAGDQVVTRDSGMVFVAQIDVPKSVPKPSINSLITAGYLKSPDANSVNKAEIIVWKEVVIDTSMLADSSWLIGYFPSGLVVTGLMCYIDSKATSPTGTPYVEFGHDKYGSLTPLISNPSADISKGIFVTVTSFTNKTIPVGNGAWIKFKGSPSFKVFYIGIKGHRL